MTPEFMVLINRDNPLGGSSNLHSGWRSICGHFERSLEVQVGTVLIVRSRPLKATTAAAAAAALTSN